MRTACVTFILIATASALAVPQHAVEPTFKDVRYGPHERNVMNVWKASTNAVTPVLIYIHGGGWLHGNKHETMWYYPYLDAGVSVVSTTYRLAPTNLVPAPLLDAARAVQFVRYKAKEWGFDKTRVAVAGGSAGGCTSLWLAYHDDLADPDNPDPVLRESTKPTCAAVGAAQTFIDSKMVKQFVGMEALGHGMIWMTVGAKSRDDTIENHAKYAELYREYSAYYHVDAKDPPVHLRYSEDKRAEDKIGDGIHSARFGFKLEEKAKAVGATIYLVAPGREPPAYRGESGFVLKMLKAGK